MITKTIESTEQWTIYKRYLIQQGYKLWQTQYGTDTPNGYQARFMTSQGCIEVITHNREIELDIMNENAFNY